MVLVEALEKYSLSDSDIRRILGKGCKIIKYSELPSFGTIENLLPKEKAFAILLIEDSLDHGHWTGICRFKNTYMHFDSYGNPVDADLKWTDMATRKQLNEDKPFLSQLLDRSDRDCIYNNIKYQEMDQEINTCGDHICSFLYNMKHNDMDLRDYYMYMKEIKRRTGHTYDEIVSLWAQQFLKLK
jgi:hypothetical protein